MILFGKFINTRTLRLSPFYWVVISVAGLLIGLAWYLGLFYIAAHTGQEYNHYACMAVGKEDDCQTPLGGSR